MTESIAPPRDRAEELLRELAGPAARLREDQWTAIEALVVERRRVLVVQRTGWGKSAVYFISAMLLREEGAGPTVIISPLLALMRNQVAAAERAGVRAVTLNSTNVTEWAAIHADIAAGAVDVLLVSPERLNNPDFRDQVLPELARDAGMVVIDEAHCVSDWGHDFRPDYRRIRTLIAELSTDIPVLATTATANDRVVADVREQLAGSDEPTVLRGGLDRESLHLSVVRIVDPVARIAWLADYLERVEGSGIVYALTVAAAHDVAEALRERGLDVLAYTGRTEAAERESAEADLLANRVKALVATSALGMGFDKPDLAFVVHLGAPSSPIAYYQQIGRAGRATERAEVALLPGAEDEAIWRYFASVAFPREQVVRRVLDALDTEAPRSTAAIEPLVDLNRTRLEMVLKVLDVDGAVRRVRGGWLATGMPWEYDTRRYEGLADARRAEEQAMRHYQELGVCRMAFLRRQLDDPTLPDDAAAAACGRCDVCTGTTATIAVSDDAVARARAILDRPGVELAPRRQWPTGLRTIGVDLAGKIPDGPDAGRAIGRLTDPVWGARLRAALDGPDAPPDDQLVQAAIRVLAAWKWETRPTAVLAIDNADRPLLVRGLAEALARVGRLELLEPLHRRSGAITAANSAHRVAALLDDLIAPDPIDSGAVSTTGPILMVDALWDTGWTATVAGRLLRRAGAPAVLPLAIAAAG